MASLSIGRHSARSIHKILSRTHHLQCRFPQQRFLQTSTGIHQKVPDFAFAFEYSTSYLRPNWTQLIIPQHRRRPPPQLQPAPPRPPSPLLPPSQPHPLHPTHQWRRQERSRPRGRAQQATRNSPKRRYVRAEPHAVRRTRQWRGAI